jgi:hypothetical protein
VTGVQTCALPISGLADGSFANAQLDEPEGLAVSGRHLLVADTGNHAVRVADLEARQVWTLEIG